MLNIHSYIELEDWYKFNNKHYLVGGRGIKFIRINGWGQGIRYSHNELYNYHNHKRHGFIITYTLGDKIGAVYGMVKDKIHGLFIRYCKDKIFAMQQYIYDQEHGLSVTYRNDQFIATEWDP